MTTGRATRGARSPTQASSSRGAAPVDPRRRMLVLLIGFVVVGVAFVGVLVDLQTVRPDEYRVLGETQRIRTQTLSGYRGAILDRDGFVLATSTPGHVLVADPQMIDDPRDAAALLAPHLAIDARSLEDELLPETEGDRFTLIAETVDDETAARLRTLLEDPDLRPELTGLFLLRQEQRVYPGQGLARPVVGGVDPDERGVYGIEYQFDDIMTGTPGYEQSEQGLFGSISAGQYLREMPVEGHDVVLTLDHRIQYVTEESLSQHCEDTEADNASAVVTDPRTGELLAMATVIRRSNGTCTVPRHNVPLVDTFEPGSVLKIVTAAAVVEELGMSGSTVIEVPQSIVVEDKTFVDQPAHAAAPYPIDQIIANSMNVGTIKLAQELGKERLYDYLTAFGFGQPTGLEFKDEARGTVRETNDWWGSDLGSIPIGQGVTTNAVQLAAAFNVIANDGFYLSPKLVRGAIGPDGAELDVHAQQSRRVVSPETAAEVSDMLVGVVNSGTGTAAAIPGYTVAGKTGTAWKVFDDGSGELTYGTDGNRRYIVSFAGFLPAENPQLSIVVVVDEPVTETSAGKVAAPVFADIAHYALRILAIPPGQDVTGPGGGRVRGTPAADPRAVIAGTEEAALGDGEG